MFAFSSILLLLMADQHIEAKNYDTALSLLNMVDPKTVNHDEYYFKRSVCQFATLDRKGAAESIKEVEDSFNLPRRHHALVSMMKEDLDKWKDGDLSDVSRRMRESGERLENGKVGPITQEKQKKILFRLDELIKEKESQAKGGQANAGGCPDGGKRTPGASGGPPVSPAQDSQGGNEGGKGEVLERKIKHYQDNWGTLPEHERARAIQELTKDVPPRYKQVIEEYFKLLNR